MIVTPRFAFLSLHQSGGALVNKLLLNFVADATLVGHHLPRSMIPVQFSKVPVLGVVRNPWSYYAAWYKFQKERSHPNFLFRILSDNGRLDFRDTLYNMLDLGSGSLRLELLLKALPGSYGNPGLNLPSFALAPIRDTGIGFYSYLYRYLYSGGQRPVVAGRMEDLPDELPFMLESVAQRVSTEMKKFIDDEAPRHLYPHIRFKDCYDSDMQRRVARRDAEIIDRHHYRFEAA